MKKLTLVLSLGIILFSCNNDKKTDIPAEDKNGIPNAEASAESNSEEIKWGQIPEIKDIGTFPFITAPAGLKIKDEKDGASEVFPDAKMEIYNGKTISTVEGKLAALSFESENGKDFSKVIFDKNIYSYFDKIGAKLLYKGNFPEDETQKVRLEKNLWNGKNATYAIFRESEAPFTMYAFRNNGKNYVASAQANSAQGNVFVMEVENQDSAVK